jgi:aspartate aminotransferase
MKALDEAGIEYAPAQGAFYMFCKVPKRKNADNSNGADKEFCEHLKKYLILGVPGSGFGKPGWLRFAYCVDEKIISNSASAFKKAMESW